jgi:hypothetical protein
MRSKEVTYLPSLLGWLWRASLVILAVLVFILAWLVASGDIYKSGSTLGYNLGLAGGLMMLTLLLYPLRKRLNFMSKMGPLKHWFRYHMALGIGGPLLIMFHSTFKIGSMNGRVALYSMLLVTFSGVVGRFVYRHIHRGLYGSKKTLAEANEELSRGTDNIRSVLSKAPFISERLKTFHDYAFAKITGFAGLWRFVTLRWRGHHLAHVSLRDARRTVKQTASANDWSRDQVDLHSKQVTAQIDSYIDAVCDASQFEAWERLFSLWHVVHVPFLYLLALSGIVHVVAVHMY